MLNILVTGADGQLGRELRLLGVSSADNYIFTDAADLDIADEEAVQAAVAALKADVIINCAAYTNVEKAEDDYPAADRINHKAVKYLSAAAKENDALLIHISTDYVFNGGGNVPYREDAATSPLGVYGKTKLAGERSVKSSGCRHIIIRTAWLYSEFGNNFVKTMLHLTTEKETLNVVFDQTGSPTCAADLASAIFGMVENRTCEIREGIYHFSNEGICSWYDFAVEIARMAGNTKCVIRPCHSTEFPSKVRRPAYSVLDKTKIKEAFGITIPHWRESLETCINKLQQK